MTDTDTQTIDSNLSTDDKISALASLVETIAKGQKAMTEGLNRFSTAVVETLSGQQVATTSAPAKRRGRPPKAASEAATASAAPVRDRPLHPKAVQMAEMVKRAKRLTQTEVANQLGVERSHVQSFADPLLEKGLIKAVYYKRPGAHRHLVYYRPDQVNIQGE